MYLSTPLPVYLLARLPTYPRICWCVHLTLFPSLPLALSPLSVGAWGLGFEAAVCVQVSTQLAGCNSRDIAGPDKKAEGQQ